MSEGVYAHQDFLRQDSDLTDFELELISGGQNHLWESATSVLMALNPIHSNRLTKSSALRCL